MNDTSRAQRFMEALTAVERDRDTERMASLFGPNSEIGNIASPHRFSGVDGARQFWQAYRETFEEVSSEFRNVIECDDRAALEWKTSGTNTDGVPFSYTGVSVLEFSGGHISRFWAYFNPSDLGHQLEQKAPQGYS